MLPLALVGWYLMIPPMEADYTWVTGAPLPSWTIKRSFDTAVQCEAVRVAAIKQTEKNVVVLNLRC
jgi:hypothetical protein